MGHASVQGRVPLPPAATRTGQGGWDEDDAVPGPGAARRRAAGPGTGRGSGRPAEGSGASLTSRACPVAGLTQDMHEARTWHMWAG